MSTSEEARHVDRRGRRRARSVVAALALGLLVPLALLALLEGAFRLLDVGRPTSFFVPVGNGDAGNGFVTTNQLYGYTLFDGSYSIRPWPARIERQASGDGRVVVLGASAAYGDVAPGFSLARVLEARLRELAPDRSIEVVNAALPGVNSHVVLGIAREALRLDSDALVVYLGNNEVVGPYGPGSVAAVAGSKEADVDDLPPSRLWIRTHLRLRSLRWATLLGALTERSPRSPSVEPGPDADRDHSWVERLEVGADDPRLGRVHRLYEQNLRALVRLARDEGVPVVLSTVGSNVLDFPPFASRLPDELDAAARARFEAASARGVEARRTGDCAAALPAFDEALGIDDGFADAWFHRGRCLLEMGRADDARDALERAALLDRQRYRPHPEIQAVVRRVAAEEDGAVLVDGASALAGADGLGGSDAFYDHVHLTFTGVVRLAEAMLPAVAEALDLEGAPEAAVSGSDALESIAIRVARALVLDRRAEAEASRSIVRREAQPMMAARRAVAEGLAPSPPRFSSIVVGGDELETLRRALRASPRDGDPALRARLAEALERQGQEAGALVHWNALVEALPSVTTWQAARARLLLARGEPAAAVEALEAVVARDRYHAGAAVGLANALRSLDPERAEAAYRRAVDRHPGAVAAYLGLASLLVEQRRLDDARSALERAVEADPASIEARTDLAMLLAAAGELEQARMHVAAALRVAPLDPALRRLAGRLGDPDF